MYKHTSSVYYRANVECTCTARCISRAAEMHSHLDENALVLDSICFYFSFLQIKSAIKIKQFKSVILCIQSSRKWLISLAQL